VLNAKGQLSAKEMKRLIRQMPEKMFLRNQ
jgi:hypothetical protein